MRPLRRPPLLKARGAMARATRQPKNDGMMPRGSELLLPVNPLFIWLSLFLALSLNMLPWGRVAGVPDFLAVALVFWNVHQPRRVGVGAAFVLGLLMDVHQGALLGQHALAYTLSVELFCHHGTPPHAVVHGGLASRANRAAVRGDACRVAAGAHDRRGGVPWLGFAGRPLLIESVLWPLASFVLLAPQRRAPDRDKNRPL